MLCGDAGVAAVIEHGVEDANHHADGDADKSKAADPGRPTAVAGENNGERREEEVQNTVDDRDVYGHDEHDGFTKQQNPGSHKRLLDLIATGGLLRFSAAVTVAGHVELGDVHAAGDAGELFGAAAEEDGRVGFGDESGTGNPEDSGEDGHEALHPAPTFGFAQKTAGDGTDGGAEEGGDSEDAGGDTSFCIKKSVLLVFYWICVRDVPSAVNMSAMTPPQLVRGEEPNAPAKKRRMMSVSMFCEPAAPALKAVRAM